jgi:diadenosine tetraphosphate (Ap4A) HIT family hydrolase
MVSTATGNAGSCVFCSIIARRSPAYVVYEDEATMEIGRAHV